MGATERPRQLRRGGEAIVERDTVVVDAVEVDAVVDAVAVDAPVDAPIDAVAGPYVLAVTKTGTGSGTVVSSPVGINCGAVCVATFPAGTVVSLAAIPAAGSQFVGWNAPSCASSSSTCTEVMEGSITVTAQFDAL